MTNPKQRRAPSKKHLNESSVEGDWILVKKQKITIIIPPLSDKVIPAAPQEKPESVSIHETQISKSSSSCRGSSEDCSPLRSYREEDMDNKGIMIYSDSCNLFLDRRMRASCLEKKLKKAGGLENWLVSLGLGQSVRVFRTTSVKKFHLANLTMKKLKDMGTDAVGPRRKLMHAAIDCLCEPHCFLGSLNVGNIFFFMCKPIDVNADALST